MKQIATQAIVLSRTDYGEADRILTLLTPDYGKLSLIAKGVRRIKSKMAGGIELFSVSDIGFIRGRSNLGTLVSTRLVRHYGDIVTDISRTMLGYDLIKLLNKSIEDEPDAEYFTLLEHAFAALDDPTIDVRLIRIWFIMQLLRLDGHTPNLMTELNGDRLLAERSYGFNFGDMAFSAADSGPFQADHIKFLRVGFAGNRPEVMQKISGLDDLLDRVAPLVQTMGQTYLRT